MEESHWDYLHYDDEYIDISYIQKMEDILKLKCNRYPPDELPLSPKQRDLHLFHTRVRFQSSFTIPTPYFSIEIPSKTLILI